MRGLRRLANSTVTSKTLDEQANKIADQLLEAHGEAAQVMQRYADHLAEIQASSREALDELRTFSNMPPLAGSGDAPAGQGEQ